MCESILCFEIIGRKGRNENVVYIRFIELEKAYKVNKEALWHLIIMYITDGKLLNGIMGKYISLSFVKEVSDF